MDAVVNSDVRAVAEQQGALDECNAPWTTLLEQLADSSFVSEARAATLRAIANHLSCVRVSPSQAAPANPAQVTDAIDEGLEILGNLIDNITRHGNYSAESTCMFIDQAGQTFRHARAALTAAKAQSINEFNRVADALEACDWSGPSIGNKAILQKAVEILRSAAIGAGGQAVAVKPLVWSEDRDDDGTEIHRTRGGEVNLPYAVYEDGFIKKPFGLSLNQLRIGSFDTVVEAKAAAQKDYERRILSALSQPHPADERVVEALRKLNTPPSPVQKLGAAISRRDWHEAEQAHAFIRDALDSFATEGQ